MRREMMEAVARMTTLETMLDTIGVKDRAKATKALERILSSVEEIETLVAAERDRAAIAQRLAAEIDRRGIARAEAAAELKIHKSDLTKLILHLDGWSPTIIDRVEVWLAGSRTKRARKPGN